MNPRTPNLRQQATRLKRRYRAVDGVVDGIALALLVIGGIIGLFLLVLAIHAFLGLFIWAGWNVALVPIVESAGGTIGGITYIQAIAASMLIGVVRRITGRSNIDLSDKKESK